MIELNDAIGKTFWCISCKKNVSIVASRKQWEQYHFPELTADEREIMTTGMCGECFDKIFKRKIRRK